MRKIIVLAAMLVSSVAAAEEPSSEKVDYSKEALRQFFAEGGTEKEPPRSPFDFGLVFLEGSRYRLRWMPLMAPLILSQTSGSPGINTNPIVDPFALTGSSYGATPAQARDRFRDWRERRALRRFVDRANASDNGRR